MSLEGEGKEDGWFTEATCPQGHHKFFPEPYNGKWGIVLPFNLLDCSPGTGLTLELYNSVYYSLINQKKCFCECKYK